MYCNIFRDRIQICNPVFTQYCRSRVAFVRKLQFKPSVVLHSFSLSLGVSLNQCAAECLHWPHDEKLTNKYRIFKLFLMLTSLFFNRFSSLSLFLEKHRFISFKCRMKQLRVLYRNRIGCV